ncbi:protein SGT1 homolog [Lineus longissimus]|uniref:protein SGT1 homolog n=1 Tax=Lineus longissimus TaxID=88925 RepID=UPI002B4C63B4
MATVDDSDAAVANILLEEGKYQEALELAQKAVESSPKDARAYLAKGTACFHLDKFPEAKSAFIEGQKLDDSNAAFKTWLRKCDAELDLAKKENSGVGSSSGSDEKPKPPPMPSGQKTRYDWYQTETHVIVNVMLKNVKQEDCNINIQTRTFSATVKQPSGSEYSLELDLAHAIDPEKSSTQILKPKIEVKLKKVDGIRWTALEGEPENIKQFTPGSTTTTGSSTKYPSASKKDWDKIAAEVEEDKPEGDAALNELFQKIYADGGDDVKKAMQKSFFESGGTVLSTNWNEIGKEKVEVKPPDGMEFKKWDG